MQKKPPHKMIVLLVPLIGLCLLALSAASMSKRAGRNCGPQAQNCSKPQVKTARLGFPAGMIGMGPNRPRLAGETPRRISRINTAPEESAGEIVYLGNRVIIVGEDPEEPIPEGIGQDTALARDANGTWPADLIVE